MEQYVPLYISKGSDLSIPETFLLRENSRGIHPVSSFIKKFKDDPIKNLLVLGHRSDQLYDLSSNLGLTVGSAIYYSFVPPNVVRTNLGANTEVFMNEIAIRQRETVFFVPNNFRQFPPDKSVTSEELLWCLDNPSKIRNFSFVFGLYELPLKTLWTMFR